MPLTRPEDFGTDRAGYRVNDYCRHCYADGAFTEPDITMDAMLEKCVHIMADMKVMPEPQARTLMTETMPRLRRWRAAAAVGP